MEKRQKAATLVLASLAVLLIMGFITYHVWQKERAATGAFEDELRGYVLELAENEEFLNKKLRENKNLAEKFKSSASELSLTNDALRSALAEIDLRSAEIRELKNLAEQKQNLLAEKFEQTRRLLEKIARLENELSILREGQNDATEETRRKEIRLHDLEKTLVEAADEIDRLADSLARAQRETAARAATQAGLQQKLEETQRQLNEACENLALAESQLADLEISASKSLAAKRSDLELLVADNIRLKNELRAGAEKNAAAKSLLPQLALAQAAEKGRVIATVHFPTGSWYLSAKQRQALSEAIGQTKGLDKNDYCLLLKGRSDRQKYGQDHEFRNLELSALRSLAVSRLLLDTADDLPSLTMAGEGDVFAADPDDNRTERAVHVYLVPKNALDPKRILELIKKELH